MGIGDQVISSPFSFPFPSLSQMLYRNLLFIGLIFLSACAYTTKVTDGKTAVELKQYATAIPMLKKEFNRAKLRSEKGKNCS